MNRFHPQIARDLSSLGMVGGMLLAGMFLWLAAPLACGEEDAASTATLSGTDQDRQHWSFKPLRRIKLPRVNDTAWPRTPVDFFILARLESAGLTPAREAEPATLLRRLYFDLVGLPPAPADIDAFILDQAPGAYERLVDRLLASPHFGERWGQHWLDLARFAETDGFEHDKIRPTAWKYRDWVINVLNADMPYDEFVRQQIAGDVLHPHDPSATIATAFCLSGPDMPDINSQAERTHTLLNELTSTVGSVFLGLQIGCAQCHDHRYDPVSQADFYSLRAFFAPAVRVERDKSVAVLTSAPASPAPSYLMIRGDWRRPGPVVQPAYPHIADPWKTPVRTRAADGRRGELARWLTRPDHPLATRVIVNRVWQYHFGRGLSTTSSDFGLMGDKPSHPELLDWLADEFVASGWSLKNLHRLIVTSSVYRQRSMRAPDDASADAWRTASETDPQDMLLWRFPRRRLEAEVVRDALFAVSDSLVTQMGGPGVKPPLPAELVNTLLKDHWQPNQQISDHYRRSVYVFARRNLRYPLFAAFDRPAANSSCAARQQSTTAPQSLLLLNSAVSLDAARRLAGTIWNNVGSDAERQIVEAFRRVLGRNPDSIERDKLTRFLTSQKSLLAKEERTRDALAIPRTDFEVSDTTAAAALTDLCLALLNSSEFLYVD
jgi:hypothetical protein